MNDRLKDFPTAEQCRWVVKETKIIDTIRSEIEHATLTCQNCVEVCDIPVVILDSLSRVLRGEPFRFKVETDVFPESSNQGNIRISW